MNTHEIVWAVGEARKAMQDNHLDLAERYLEKIEEQVWCMICHQPLDDKKPYFRYFKGFVHYECKNTYAGRSDYLRRNEQDTESTNNES